MDKKYYLLKEDAIECFPIRIHSGNNQLRIKSKSALKQYRNGLVCFNPSDNTIYNKYYIVGYEWNGAKYFIQTANKTSGKGVGAQLIGASGVVAGKGKSSGTQKEIEENTIAFMDLQSFETGEVQKISFLCNTKIDARVRCLKMFEQMDSAEISNNFKKLVHDIEENQKIEDEKRRKIELEKELERQKINEERELRKQKIRQEKELNKQKINEERELEKQKTNEERELRKQDIKHVNEIKKSDSKQRNTSVFAIVGFIFSIIALLISCIVLGIIPGIIALILCIIALIQDKYKNKILAKIGLGLSIASIIIS